MRVQTSERLAAKQNARREASDRASIAQLSMALERVRYEYAEMSDMWKMCETKANWMLAITTGYFLALISHLNLNELRPSDSEELGCLFIAIPSLLLSAVLAFQGMLVKSIFLPPSGKEVDRTTRRLLKRYPLGSRSESIDVICTRWLLKNWIEVVADLDLAYGTKIETLARCQTALGLAFSVAPILALCIATK